MGTPNISEAVIAWMSSPSAKACLSCGDIGDMGEHAQLDLAVVGRDELARFGDEGLADLPPASVRTGMFCRLGSDEDSRPVVVAASAKLVCTRPVSGLMPGSASV
jgi:hypothetical protein